MPCHLKDRDKIISRYLLHELSEAEAMEFQAHFFECEECFQEITFKRKALRLFHDRGEEILESIETEPEPELDRATRGFFARYLPHFATAAAVAIVMALVIQFTPLLEKPADQLWQRDMKVPYEYRPGDSFRSAGTPSAKNTADSLAGQLQRGINRSMGAYNQPNYALMLQNMAQLEAAAAHLRGQLSAQDTAAAMILRDYEFYYGVSRLARARTQITDLDPKYREQLLREAVTNISLALDLAAVYGKTDTDKEHYFLGLAYGFSGQFSRAVEALEKVTDVSNPQFDSLASFLKLWKNR